MSFDKDYKERCADCGTPVGIQHLSDCSYYKSSTIDHAEVPEHAGALGRQEGGTHYKNRAIQPIEYIIANKLNYIEGCVVKRITRWRDKGGLEDLRKIQHEIDLMIELEGITK